MCAFRAGAEFFWIFMAATMGIGAGTQQHLQLVVLEPARGRPPWPPRCPVLSVVLKIFFAILSKQWTTSFTRMK